jgi:Holliday junction resolvase-like predicted endonuclease
LSIIRALNKSPQKKIYKKLLSLTLENNSITLEKLRKESKITNELIQNTISNLNSMGLISINGNIISLDLDQRLKLAIKLVEVGGDLRDISDKLGWLEFEEFSARVFQENGFNVMKRFRFQAEGRRWEIDVLASSYPYIICAECKHWTSGMGNSAARSIIETHLEKVKVLSDHIDEFVKRIKVHRWKSGILIPMALTLSPTRMKIYRRVPSVSVHALPSFLNEFSGYLERIVHFSIEIPEYKPRPRQTKLR